MSFDVSGFDWDDGNRMKCGKHGVPLAEIEQALRNDPLVLADRTGSMETRFNAVGVNDQKRHVFVVFTLRDFGGRKLIRPLSARYMHAKEIKTYDRSKGS
ncbi:MAG: BrnT family toxin [Beijerinckiaceae bacterium]|nr:BrnT family toxin [Beijerinckiaceae bacterium]